MKRGMRTLLLSLVGIGALLAGLSLTTSEKMYDGLMYGVVLLVFSLAGRSSVEALAGGGGIKGAISALTTRAKPEGAPDGKD